MDKVTDCLLNTCCLMLRKFYQSQNVRCCSLACYDEFVNKNLSDTKSVFLLSCLTRSGISCLVMPDPPDLVPERGIGDLPSAKIMIIIKNQCSPIPLTPKPQLNYCICPLKIITLRINRYPYERETTLQMHQQYCSRQCRQCP